MEGNWVGMRGSGTVKIVGVHGVARRMGVKVPGLRGRQSEGEQV